LRLREERWILTVGKQHLRPLHPLAAGVRKWAMAAKLSTSSSVIANSTACRHPAMPLLVRSNTNEEFIGSMISFMESVVPENDLQRMSQVMSRHCKQHFIELARAR
jgi:hypothetical protein